MPEIAPSPGQLINSPTLISQSNYAQDRLHSSYMLDILSI